MKKSERWTMIERGVKRKGLRRQPRSGWLFFTKCVRNIIEKAVSICVIIPKDRKVKKFRLHYRSEFRAQRYGYKLPKKVGKPWFEKDGAHVLQACVRRICKLYTKGGPAGKLTSCKPPRDHLDYRRLDNIQRSSPQNTWRAKTVTTLRLEKCDFGNALGARTCYTSPLRKCQKAYKKTFWFLIFQLFNVKWIMNNKLSFTKGFFFK